MIYTYSYLSCRSLTHLAHGIESIHNGGKQRKSAPFFDLALHSLCIDGFILFFALRNASRTLHWHIERGEGWDLLLARSHGLSARSSWKPTSTDYPGTIHITLASLLSGIYRTGARLGGEVDGAVYCSVSDRTSHLRIQKQKHLDLPGHSRLLWVDALTYYLPYPILPLLISHLESRLFLPINHAPPSILG
ncbi:uncharacterized protein BDV17DRAFT_96768 [Aspergillus undulatus]|uniref:uncharacterized protein n=1 Tax=Aspergillus undulatus TaxID=1810928 RepID=UPI003CCD7678